MNLIQCAKDCRFQRDGYCTFDTIGTVNNTAGGCAHYLSRSSGDNLNGAAEVFGADNGDGII